MVLTAVPFLLVTFPPITDLPQQTAQIRLMREVVEGSETYRIQAFHPNKLSYLAILIGWHWGGGLGAGRLGLLLIGLLWVGAIHALARATGRDPSLAVLASLFFFSHATYWGFLNFLIGFPAFLLWYVVVDQLESPLRARGGLKLLLVGALLYTAHVLWLALGLLWLGVVCLLERGSPLEIVRRFAWLAPVGLAVVAWYSAFAASGVDARTFWGRPPWIRLSPDWMLPAVFGGLEGPLEGAVALFILAWLGLGLWQHRGQLASAMDSRLALLGGLLFAAVLVLPEVHQHTIYFAARWATPAAVFLVLACPAPRLRPTLREAVPWLLLITLITATAAAWMGFEQQEMAGFEASLEALPRDSRLLGLDLIRTSPRIRSFPYYHLFAYAQVLRGAELNRTFADEASSLVVFRELPHVYPWTEGLEWKPERFRQSDRDHFDYILVQADAEKHGFFLRDSKLEPATAAARWRLYRVK